MKDRVKVIWTITDEAPYLATFSLLPIVKKFFDVSDIEIDIKDISLSSRILANFSDFLTQDQRVSDDLSILGELVNKPDTILIKLPNISASLPQLKDAIKELQAKGFNIPDYPDELKSAQDEKIRERYSKILGSAVNPVLRQGNNIRAVPRSIKETAKKFPDLMGLPLKEWNPSSKTHVSHMTDGDFYGHERSITLTKDTRVRIEFIDKNNNITIFKDLDLLKGEIFDGSFISIKALSNFYENQIRDAKKEGILWSLHLKATMMKVSDPVLFGYAIRAYFKDVFAKHQDTFNSLGVNPNNGLSDLFSKLENLSDDKKVEIKKDIEATYEKNPGLYMVDSNKGITNLHMPNLVLIDASIPTIIRDGGKAWGPDGKLHDVKIVIPDRSYATIYSAIVEDCKKNGAFDRTTMGTVIDVGLIAMKAEEYGSHDKTFLAPDDGTFRVVDVENGQILMEHSVEKGDIWRGCQVKDVAIKNWIQIAIEETKKNNIPAIFWLDENRPHDREEIKKIREYLKTYDLRDLDIKIMRPSDAMKATLELIRRGQDVIAVTGNILRDYLSDLFPILEVGTSAKVFSIIPLLSGGRMFETGAGGSAPKHVEQFINQNHLRWDSIAEFVAISQSLKFIFDKYNYKKAFILANACEGAISDILSNKKWPSRKVGEIDNRGEHYYFMKYWANHLSSQQEDIDIKEKFLKVKDELDKNEDKINEELLSVQGKKVDIKGYYKPEEDIVERLMRPSKILNSIVNMI
ncbi:isocitrate dehydrogenase, NADP-dependent [Thermodesulfobium narugense DSM 14796]|uniref:isocitrate dehydrogenase (NADP(+)) n=1 Tax=Thermodesulfobium narugense DSM 14796 TaxID=747365 RepID=M1E507_9BACT|nr:NADP-dependent isocitrate dehydrogenase [Thermodesulfobium narugense]AEE14722.1 isocitrate dehydrogenase, NADP-dependent [Thermodesulfobium narugense DSM 14796]